jgi:Ca2+-binding RTX toxin-like protein
MGDTFASMVTAEFTNKDGDDMEMSVPDIVNLKGSANADILAGDLRDNMIEGGDGDDKIFGGPGPSDGTGTGDDSNADTLMGGGGDDMIFGGAGDDTLVGGDGDDMLVGGTGDDEYMGGAGDDMIIADADDTPGNTPGTANIDGGEGNDTISYANLEDTPGARTLGGTTLPNIENIIGSQDDDEIDGDAMDNVIEGGEGGDDLDGGGNPATGAMGDTLSYASSDDWVRVTARPWAIPCATSSWSGVRKKAIPSLPATAPTSSKATAAAIPCPTRPRNWASRWT